MKKTKRDKIKSTQIMTPPLVVKQMLDLFDSKIWDDDSTYFFEPSCGDGAFLVELIDRSYHALLLKYDKKFPDHPHNRERSIAETIFKIKAIDIDGEMVIKARKRCVMLVFSLIKKEKLDKSAILNILIALKISEAIECKDFFDVFKKTK